MPAMQRVPSDVATITIKAIGPNVFGSVSPLPLKGRSQEEHFLAIHFTLKSTVFTQIQLLRVAGSTSQPQAMQVCGPDRPEEGVTPDEMLPLRS